MSSDSKPAPKPFVTSRTFAAPRQRVWSAWTDPAELKRWQSMGGMALVKCDIDLRPGGEMHYGMRSPEGHEMWGKWRILEVAAPERLVYLQCFSDAAGGVTAHPAAPTWPKWMHSTILFRERGAATEMEVRWLAHEPTPTEQATFDGAFAGMQQGWSGMLDQLATYVERKA